MSDKTFLLTKRGLYYRPDNAGYTGIKEYAGRYREVDALGLDGVAAVHEDDAPEYSGACFPDLAQKHLQERLSASLARIETLEAALRPFANATAIHFDHYEGDIMMVLTYPSGEPTGANLMSLENARAALKED